MVLRYPVVLASASPRRHRLLAELLQGFEVVVADVNEDPLPGEEPIALARRLALTKAQAVAKLRPDAFVIAGDTVVAYADPDWRLLAKPGDAKEACAMLRALSGRSHSVITGVSIVWPDGEETFHDETTVAFRDLSDEEIEAYVASGDPMDKAGAYAIQGGAARFVSLVTGSVSNVVGLPLEALKGTLERISV